MMSTRRSLFVFGALLAVGVLLTPQSAFAQSPPTAVAASAGTVTGTDASAEVTFTQPNDATSAGPVVGYEIGYVAGAAFTGMPTVASRFNYVAVDGGTVPAQTISGLDPATQYTVGVRSFASNGNDSTWATHATAATFTTGPATVLAAPTTFSVATGNAAGEVNATWSVVSGATGYSIRSMPQGGSVWTVRQVTGGSTSTATISGLAAGSHSFQIATMNSAGTGTYSASQTATPGSAPVVAMLPAPSNFTVTSGTAAGSVTATWTAVTGATGYSIQSRPSNSSAWASQTVSGGTTTTATITGLTVGTMYYFKIATMNTAGTGDYTTEDVSAEPGAGPAAVLPSPTSVYLTPSGRDQIIISWAHGKRADGTEDPTRIRYDVGWTDAAGTEFVTGGLSPQVIVPVPGGRAAKSHTLTNLKVDQSYLVAVRPVSGDAAGSTTTVGDWTYGVDARQDPASYGRRQRTPDRTSQPQGVRGERE